MGVRVPDRAVLFVDGNNFYHSLRGAGASAIGNISLAKVSKKLVGPRTWQETRYYIGQVKQHGNHKLYSEQRKYVSRQEKDDARTSFHFGRLEPRTTKNELAEDLDGYLSTLPARIDPQAVASDLATQNGIRGKARSCRLDDQSGPATGHAGPPTGHFRSIDVMGLAVEVQTDDDSLKFYSWLSSSPRTHAWICSRCAASRPPPGGISLPPTRASMLAALRSTSSTLERSRCSTARPPAK